MDKVTSRLTVYFQEPFWVGIFECVDEGRLYAAKTTFGAEPKDYEIAEFVKRHYYDLPFRSSVEAVVTEEKKNPKRMLREAKKQVQSTGVGTKSQQLLKLQQEQFKKMRKQKSRAEKEEAARLHFEQKQVKRKEKHKGH